MLIISGYAIYKIHQNRKNRNDTINTNVGFSMNNRSIRSNGSGSSDGSGTVIIAADANYNSVRNNAE